MQPSFVTRTDDPNALAKRAITLLERHIQQEFGAQVRMGAELEFTVAHDSAIKNPLGLPDPKEAKAVGFVPSGKRDLKQRDALFPNSPSVCYSYKEHVQEDGLTKYEVVVSHEATDGRNQHAFSRGKYLADNIHALKKLLPAAHEDSRITVKGKPSITSLSLDAAIGRNLTNSQHITLSLLDADNHPVLDAHQYRDLATSMQRYVLEHIRLLGDDEKSKARWLGANRSDRLEVYAPSVDHGFDFDHVDYLENRFPSAASNPYIAVLLTLAACEAGLSVMAKNPRDFYPRVGPGSNTKLATAQCDAALTQDMPIFQLLNTLEPQLGTRFAAALVHAPEQTQQAARPR
jgi:glutamine synthetase